MNLAARRLAAAWLSRTVPGVTPGLVRRVRYRREAPERAIPRTERVTSPESTQKGGLSTALSATYSRVRLRSTQRGRTCSAPSGDRACRSRTTWRCSWPVPWGPRTTRRESSRGRRCSRGSTRRKRRSTQVEPCQQRRLTNGRSVPGAETLNVTRSLSSALESTPSRTTSENVEAAPPPPPPPAASTAAAVSRQGLRER